MPWYKFYAGDWFSDGKLRKCKAEGVAVWIQALAWMHLEDTYEITGDIDEIAMALNLPYSQTEEGIVQLEKHSVCEVYRDHHGVVTLTSRRIKREHEDRESARERKRLERERKAREEAESQSCHSEVTDESLIHTRGRALTSDSNSTSNKEKKVSNPQFVSQSPPPLSEIEEYFDEQDGSKDEAAKFRDYYESNGWKAGRNPMKDWHAAARNWIRRADDFGRTRGSPTDPMTYQEALVHSQKTGAPFPEKYEKIKREGQKPLWKYAA